MDHILIEHTEEGKKAYKSLLVEPGKLSVLNSRLALEIVKELKRQQGCALDIARNLKEDEQKVYYYLRKLENSGIVKLCRTERRHGMTAKIYDVIAPVIATKLHDDGHMMPNPSLDTIGNPDIAKFFQPFIDDGSLDAKIIIGDPNEHGRFDTRAKEGSYLPDFSIFLGSFVKMHNFPCYGIDTEVPEKDMNGNLILVGNPRTNTLIYGLRDSLPVSFLEKGFSSFVSKKTRKEYKDPRTGFIIKMKNPSNPDKSIMVIGGIRTRGMRAAIIALTQNIEELCSGQDNGPDFLKIVKGLDREGRGIIDSVEFLE